MEERLQAKVDGWLVPGYNFCGPGGPLDAVPTSYLDTLCMYHDYQYHYDTISTERENDINFRKLVEGWANQPVGDYLNIPFATSTL